MPEKGSRAPFYRAILIILLLMAVVPGSMGCEKRQTVTPPSTKVIPQLSGLSPEEAHLELEGMGLSVRQTLEYSDGIEEGTVIATRPEAGSEVEEGTAVELVISRGPQTVEVPDVRSLTAEEASSLLQGIGLVCDSRQSSSESVSAGKVISQEPPPATRAIRGSTVVITVSTGSAWRTCPECGGSGSISDTRTCPACGGSGGCFT